MDRTILAIFLTLFLLVSIAACSSDDDNDPSCTDNTCADATPDNGTLDMTSDTTAQCGDGVCTPGEATTCPADCSAPECGDGVCNGDENCSTCVSDCGMCPVTCGDGTCDEGETSINCNQDCPCSIHIDCATDRICMDGTCENAYQRAYRFTILSAEVSSTNPQTGEAWDPFGGAPDLFAVATLNGEELGRTEVVVDSFTANWGNYVDVTMQVGGDGLVFRVFDDDPTSSPEFVTGIEANDAGWVQVVREFGGLAELESEAGVLSVLVEPL